jgi:hypothetical protein
MTNPMTIARSYEPLTHQRLWQDVPAWRLSLGLLLVPAPLVLFILVIQIPDLPSRYISFRLLELLLSSTGWCLIAGWAYSLLIARRRGIVGRLECLRAGLVLMELMLPVLWLLFWVVMGRRGFDPGIADFTAGAVLMAMFGMLGGWLLWWFGVRPAPLPDDGTSAAFE